MHFLKSILYLISSLGIIMAHAGTDRLYLKVDSIYQHMSPAEKISELIWVKTEDTNLNNSYGGVYFDQPITQNIADKAKNVAIQLDDRLNPSLADQTQLPDLFTLASITRADLLSTYFHYLKSTSKDKGIDYLILPDVAGKSEREVLLIRSMMAHDPDFFIARERIAFNNEKKKKDIIENLGGNNFWIIDESIAPMLARKIERHSEKILDRLYASNRIKQSILNKVIAEEIDQSKRRLPNKLQVEISRESIIALQRHQGILPLSRDTVCFLSNEPYGSTANMLRKYAYVITSYDDIEKSQAPVILDNDAFVPTGLIGSERMIVFVGKYENFQNHLQYTSAALIYSIESEIYDYLIPQQLFGSHNISGRLPVANNLLKGFTNEPLKGRNALGYAPPEMTGLDAEAIRKIEEIMAEAIQTGSTPGGQLAIAVDGSIILEEAYGHLTYDSLIPVDRKTLYDLASVTKVSATLLAVMKLTEQGKINLDRTVGYYLPHFINSNKQNITIKQLLSHNGGLKPYLPFWEKALTADRLETFYYETEADEKNDNRSYSIKPDVRLADSLRSWIVSSPLIKYDSIPGYNYSDIGFMILQQIVEEVAGLPLNIYLEENFYTPMGLERLTFNPLEKQFELFEIAPTEFDYYFRDELVWGVVHDRNAAVFGGIAGHAGLFSNAHELLVLIQTILQDGYYDGVQYLEPNTVATFNQRFFPNNRRALGWDKVDPIVGNASILSTEESFGHTGFTGTMIWADPAYNLIFVFLSNRIHPNSNNYQLIRRNIRTRIQDVVYEALLAKWTK
ncbi:MAG: serine hydrolase [Marinoscillum sp.]